MANAWGKTIASLIKNAMDTTLGDLASQIVYTQQTSATYDPATGVVTAATAALTFNGVLSKFDNKEADTKFTTTHTLANVVNATDAKVICSSSDLTVMPQTDDTLTSQSLLNGVPSGAITTWKVVRVLGVPGTGVWNVHIREI